MIKQSRVFYSFILLVCKIVFKFFARLKVKIPKDLFLESPVILAGNHASLVDPFVVSASFPFSCKIHPLHFITSDYWMGVPVVGFLIGSLGAFPVYKKQGLEKSLKIPYQILKEGNSLLIFPRGKMVKRFYKNKGKVGTAILALNTGIPVIPIKISDSSPKSILKLLLMKRRIKVVVGQPINLFERLGKANDFTRNDISRATEIIIEEIARLS